MVTLQNLHFRYSKHRTLFNNLSVQFESGSIYGLLGENGAGKSTLLKLMSGALFPDCGTVKVGIHTPLNRKPSFLATLFFVPEELYLPAQTMKQYVGLNAPFYPRFSEALLRENSTEFGLDLTQRFDRMSHGERKKALICFGLACQPSLLLMDEPTNGLDIPSKSRFRKVIAQSVAPDRTIIISTHQVRDLETLIDRVSILHNGSILLNEPIDRLSRQLRFGEIAPSEKAIYRETSLKGTYGIAENSRSEESRPDLELLFKAILTNQQELLTVLNNK